MIDHGDVQFGGQRETSKIVRFYHKTNEYTLNEKTIKNVSIKQI